MRLGAADSPAALLCNSVLAAAQVLVGVSLC